VLFETTPMLNKKAQVLKTGTGFSGDSQILGWFTKSPFEKGERGIDLWAFSPSKQNKLKFGKRALYFQADSQISVRFAESPLEKGARGIDLWECCFF